MKKYNVSTMTPILKKKICAWDKYKDKDVNGYNKILKYLHKEGIKKFFDEVELNEIMESLTGDEREHKMFVLEEDGEVKSFITTTLEYEDLSNPKLYIQSVATHPLQQGKGYASKLINTILKKSKKYFGLSPASVYGLVKNTNSSSQAFFQKIGQTTKIKEDEDHDIISVKLNYDKNGNLQKEKQK